MFGPSSAWARVIDSRRCHIAFACSMLVAIAVSSIRPRSSAFSSRRFQRRRAVGLALGVGLLEQHRPRRRRQRLAQRGEALSHQVEREPVHHLEAAQARAEGGAREREQQDRRLERRQGRQRGEHRRRPRLQLHRRRGDDAERAFAADHQVAQVVAGVVLAQPREAVPDLAGGRHHLEAEALLAGVAVAQHLGAAGVGGEVAADGAAALGAEAEGEQQAGAGRRLLGVLQDAAGLDRHRHVRGIDAAHPVEPGQAQHQLLAAGVGHRTSDQPGVAALGDDGRAVLGAQLHHLRHLGRAAGPDDCQRLAAPALAPVDLPLPEVVPGQHVAGADDAAQPLEQTRSCRASPPPRAGSAPARARRRR